MRAEGGPFVAGDIVRACNGTLLAGDKNVRFGGVSTDSRDIKPDDLFVALKGPTFDGHSFLLPALEAGARGCLVDRDVNREIPSTHFNTVLIQVQDTLLSLTDLASAHRSIYPIPLIAVTGSSGKTTVKEMIATVLERSHRPLISPGNLNNTIGLPMTVLNLGPDHTVAVVEAGINTVGEMEHLAQAARPDVAVITTIGPVHLEGLGSVENVAREKFKLAQAVHATGTAVVPARHPQLKPLLTECACKLTTFGIESGDWRASHITLGEQTRFTMTGPMGQQEAVLRAPGLHNIANALAAAAACAAVGMTLIDVVEALKEFRPPALRMEIIGLSGNRTLIRDCYNANPQSMKAGLDVLARLGTGPTLAILADMLELGENAERLHEELGKEAAALGISRVVFVGSFGEPFAKGFREAGGKAHALNLFRDKDTAWPAIKPGLPRFATVLVKGSRLMKMETLADWIQEEN